MKKILVLLIVLSSSSVFAKGVLSASCKQKIKDNSAKINDIADAFANEFADDYMAGVEKFNVVGVAFDLQYALEKVVQERSLRPYEASLLADICRAEHISHYRIVDALERAVEVKSAEAQLQRNTSNKERQPLSQRLTPKAAR